MNKSKFFISKKLRKNIEKDVKQKIDLEKRINSELDSFYIESDDETVLATLNYIEKNGSKKSKEIVRDISKRYQEKDLLIEDILNLIDWYEKMCDNINDES